jgi:ectoine hydroxylase-related dioxygenase (phytanoyl-CoA dioxygenase family)
MHPLPLFAEADVAGALQALNNDGICGFKAPLPSSARAKIAAFIRADPAMDAAGTAHYLGDFDELSVRVMALAPSAPDLRPLCLHPPVIRLLTDFFGDRPLLSNLSANVLLPGCHGMIMHSDQSYIPLPWPPYPIAATIGWALDPFRAENGGTRVVPGSHKRATVPDPRDFSAEISVDVPLGVCFVMDARLWHRSGENTSTQPRMGLFAHYVRPFLRQQSNWALCLSAGDLAACNGDGELAELLGLGANPTAIKRAV